MSRNVSIPAMAGLLMLASPMPAFAAGASTDEMAEMREMVQQLKGQVDAQAEQLEHQGELLKDAQKRVAFHEEEEAKSGLAPFLSDLEIDGWVAGSYFWNFNNPGAGQVGGFGSSASLGNQGAAGNFYPFHGDYDNFSLDQVWFGIGKPASEESRAGFRFDMVYGNTACFFSAATASANGTRCPGDNTSQLYVHQAYAEYLMPFGNGVTVKAGKFATLLGAEVVQTIGNYNITRGNLWNLLQPVDHLGILLSTDVGAGFSVSAGAVNGFSADDPDINKAKSLIAQVAWGSDTLSAAASIVWGGEQGPLNPATGDTGDTAGNPSGTFDFLVNWDPSEKFSSYLNFDYGWADNIRFGTMGGESQGWGVGVAGRYAVTELAGLALRFEYVEDNNYFFGFTAVAPDIGAPIGAPTDARIFGLTATADYTFMEHLLVRGEVRWDTIEKFQAENREFFDRGNKFAKNQVTAGVEVVYTF